MQNTRNKLEESRELLKTNENGLFVLSFLSFSLLSYIFCYPAFFSLFFLFIHLISPSSPRAVIGWLNKQINEQMMSGRVPLSSGPASLPLSTIRHSSSPLTTSAPLNLPVSPSIVLQYTLSLSLTLSMSIKMMPNFCSF